MLILAYELALDSLSYIFLGEFQAASDSVTETVPYERTAFAPQKITVVVRVSCEAHISFLLVVFEFTLQLSSWRFLLKEALACHRFQILLGKFQPAKITSYKRPELAE